MTITSSTRTRPTAATPAVRVLRVTTWAGVLSGSALLVDVVTITVVNHNVGALDDALFLTGFAGMWVTLVAFAIARGAGSRHEGLVAVLVGAGWFVLAGTVLAGLSMIMDTVGRHVFPAHYVGLHGSGASSPSDSACSGSPSGPIATPGREITHVRSRGRESRVLARHCGGMVALYVLGLLVLVAVTAVGVGVLRAGRELDGVEGAHAGYDDAGARRRSVAALVDASVHRTRVAVADLVEPEADQDDLRPSTAAVRDRAHTYTVVGAGLLGLGVVLGLGLLLIL